jgi:hypothetical protein
LAQPVPVLHHAIAVVDVEGFSDPARSEVHQDAVRRGLYEALAVAFRDIGADMDACTAEDRGDGAIILVPPTVPTSLLVDNFPQRLVSALLRYNPVAAHLATIRLRLALHEGQVHDDVQHAVPGLVHQRRGERPAVGRQGESDRAARVPRGSTAHQRVVVLDEWNQGGDHSADLGGLARGEKPPCVRERRLPPSCDAVVQVVGGLVVGQVAERVQVVETHVVRGAKGAHGNRDLGVLVERSICSDQPQSRQHRQAGVNGDLERQARPHGRGRGDGVEVADIRPLWSAAPHAGGPSAEVRISQRFGVDLRCPALHLAEQGLAGVQ